MLTHLILVTVKQRFLSSFFWGWNWGTKVRLLVQGLRAKKWWTHALILAVWLQRPCSYPLYQFSIFKVYLKHKKSSLNTLVREINAILDKHTLPFLPTSLTSPLHPSRLSFQEIGQHSSITDTLEKMEEWKVIWTLHHRRYTDCK